MGKVKEDRYQIAEAIERHVKAEEAKYRRNKARSRVFCTISNGNFVSDRQLWITNSENKGGWRPVTDITGHVIDTVPTHPSTLTEDGPVVYKNTPLGAFLIQHPYGTHTYKCPTGSFTYTIHNLTSYAPHTTDPIEVEMRIGEDVQRYQRLSEIKKEKERRLKDIERKRREEQLANEEIERKKKLLAKQKAKAERELAEQRARAEKELAEKKAREEREAAERKAREERELAERLAREEEERIQAEIRQKEEQAKKIKEERERNEKGLAELAEEERKTRSFLRRNASLRYQHLLDPYQDKAKRSHIFDGVPIVIEGGPGTGKTTTIIQRLKFLLSYEALTQYREIGETQLSMKQIEMLVDPNMVNNHWMFFSPTTLLLHYLRDNMLKEGLIANDDTTRTLPKYREKLLLEYQLKDSAKKAPFKEYKVKSGEERLILKPKAAIDGFTKYLITHCKKLLESRGQLDTSLYSWHNDSIGIKAYCQRAKDIKTLDDLINLFYQLSVNERQNTKEWSKSLSELLSDNATRLKMSVMEDEDMLNQLHILFEKWRNDRRGQTETEEEAAAEEESAIENEEENEPETFTAEYFENQLYSQLKKLLRQLGLNKCDNKLKLPKRTIELFEIIKPAFNEEEYDIEEIGETALFLKLYANLTNGIESNVLSIIPRVYKAYRKDLNDETIANSPYKTSLLDRVINIGENKRLHPDEQNLILGFINEMLYGIYRRSKSIFDSLKHKYVEAYKNAVKYVIGIDEATDYSIMDYYFMVSLRHYEFSSITLCGDLMQGLNDNGISDWKELQKFVLPNLEVKSLDISYRQTPTLLEVARGLYKDDMGVLPSYHSKEKPNKDAQPLLMINDDMEEKIRWISDRIADIHRQYDELLPSIAIFVGEDVNIDDFVELMNEQDLPVDVVNCSGDRQLQNNEVIRVFRLSDVKGMEFEAAFFYDIDTALGSRSEKMMRRYLYVGISRATSHLAATMSRDVMKNIQKYFETSFLEWPLV